MIVIYGAGAYGTALAINLHKSLKKVTLLSHREEHAHDLCAQNENSQYLKGIPLDDLPITSNKAVLKEASLVLLVIPAQTYSEAIPLLKPYLLEQTPLIICSKGIDTQKGALLSEVIRAHLLNPIAVLSGPHFAREVAELKPSAVTLACEDLILCERLIQALSTPFIRFYGSSDMIAAQLAGALKNVIAIACGIARGLEYGENAIAALITRGLAEIRRLGVAMGGKPESFLGLSGIGDLTLTCSSTASRNTSFGMALAANTNSDEILSHKRIEGYYTTKAAYDLKEKMNVRMPIIHMVYGILYGNKNIQEALNEMLSSQAPWEIV